MRDLIIRELGPDQDPVLKGDRKINEKLDTIAQNKPLDHLKLVIKAAIRNSPTLRIKKKISGKPVFFAWSKKGPKGKTNNFLSPDIPAGPGPHIGIFYGLRGRNLILYAVGDLKLLEDGSLKTNCNYFGQTRAVCKQNKSMKFEPIGGGSGAGADSDSG